MDWTLLGQDHAAENQTEVPLWNGGWGKWVKRAGVVLRFGLWRKMYQKKPQRYNKQSNLRRTKQYTIDLEWLICVIEMWIYMIPPCFIYLC